MNNWFKNNWQHFAAICFFVVLAFVYASPILNGKTLAQSDVIQSKAMQTELLKYEQPDGTRPLWTNQMFGGMPAYQLGIQYSSSIASVVFKGITKLLPSPSHLIVLYCFCAYILFSILGLNFWISLLGAIAIGFTSYNFIIIEAGHLNKGLAISFFPLILASCFLAYRKNYLWAVILASIGMALELRAGHIQMTYYLFLAIGLLVILQAWLAYREKAWRGFLVGSAALALGILIGMSTNITNILINREYVSETMRGGTELSLNAKDKKSVTGLDKDYAYQWSQGIGECITFMIPNAYGGGSGTKLPNDAEAVNLLTQKGVAKNQAEGFIGQFSYWGPKPFTSGPTYFGAIVLFLFILGIFIVRNPLKWWIISAVLLSVCLSLGKHFDSFSNLFFDYFPMYNKFRAVESILVVAALLIPVLAAIALQEIIDASAERKKEIIRTGKKIVYGTVGVLVLLWLVPSAFFDFQGESDKVVIEQIMQMSNGDQAFSDQMVSALHNDREQLFKNDTLRSLAFIALAITLLYLLVVKKTKKEYVLVGLALLVLVDMWVIDKRYLNNDGYVSKSKVKNYFQPREADFQILQDKDPNYRVFDVSVNTFNTASTSYFHKTIGGYSAVKLRRIQDIIEHQLSVDSGNREGVLNMLNTKYFIVQNSQKNQPMAIPNPDALGNAWFVRKVIITDGANAEMLALNKLNPKVELVADAQFTAVIQPIPAVIDTNATIKLTAYEPEHLTYDYQSITAQTVVFSEIYYKAGWKAFIDGKEEPYFRANYILRALQVPEGKHKIEFTFRPETYYTGEKISYAGSALLVLLLLGGIFITFRKKPEAIS